MEIIKTCTGEQSAILTFNISKSDYESNVEKNLHDLRRKIEVKGFRPGMAPMSLIKKIQGKAVLFDTVNKLVSASLHQYIEDNNLHVLGEPLLVDPEQIPDENDAPEEFKVSFELGMAPALTFTLSAEDKIPFYTITVTDAEKEQQVVRLLTHYEKFVDVETVEANDLLTVDLTQGDRIIKEAHLALKVLSDPERKAPFIGKKVGDTLEVDVKATFPNETDLAALLDVKKEELPGIEPVFTITINTIQRQAAAELNQEFYDWVYGQGVVSGREEFMQRVEADIREVYRKESDYRFSIDAYRALLQKANISLPDDFLKRWLLQSQQDKLTPEDIETNYGAIADELRRDLIRKYLLNELNITITNDDIWQEFRKIAAHQLNSAYGIVNATDDIIDYFANRLQIGEAEKKLILERIKDDKIMSYVKATVTLDLREITLDNLQKLYTN
jgi:trigger factor